MSSASAATLRLVQQRALVALSASPAQPRIPCGGAAAPSCAVRPCVVFVSWRMKVRAWTYRTNEESQQPAQHNTSPQRLWAADSHEEPLQGAERFTWGRLSAEAEWRGVGGDLWPLRILFWRISSDDRTVRMRTWSLTVKLDPHPS